MVSQAGTRLCRPSGEDCGWRVENSSRVWPCCSTQVSERIVKQISCNMLGRVVGRFFSIGRGVNPVVGVVVLKVISD